MYRRYVSTAGGLYQVRSLGDLGDRRSALIGGSPDITPLSRRSDRTSWNSEWNLTKVNSLDMTRGPRVSLIEFLD
jgi:hypothetical protein